MTDAPTIPAPVRNPHAPTAFTPPPLSVDAHCHIFGPAAKFPFAPNRSYTPPDSGYEDFLDLQSTLGLERAVFVQASCHGTDNSAMLDAIERGEGRFSGVAMIDDATTDAELDRMHEAGVRGIRFNFVAHLGGRPDLEKFWRLVHRVAPKGWHIVLHFDAKDIPDYTDLLANMPTPYIIDHMGRVRTGDGLDQKPFATLLDLLDDDRAWVKISGAERLSATGEPPYSDVVPFARELIAKAEDRILWGTDWPHPNVRHMPDDGDLLDFLAEMAPDPATREKILVTNPQTLYPFR